MSVRVQDGGLLTTVQAGPRRGVRHLGVPGCGAADPLSLALANRLVGNASTSAALEVTLKGPALEFIEPAAFALTGAPAQATLNAQAVPWHRTLFADRGDRLLIGAAEQGARSYLAFAGGLLADEVLGSASTYLPGGFGGYQGRALTAGDVLQIRRRDADALETPEKFRPPMTHRWALRLCRSAETHLLGDGQRTAVVESRWRVGRRSDRMGLQLDGAILDVASDGRLPSAPVFPGTIQCPEDGRPIMLGVDAQTIGGYPRVAQVARADRHLLGQLRPGDQLQFLPRQPQDAVDELRLKHDYWRAWLPDIDAVI